MSIKEPLNKSGECIEVRFICEPCATCPDEKPIIVNVSTPLYNGNTWMLEQYDPHNTAGDQPVTESLVTYLNMGDAAAARAEKRKLNIIFQRALDNVWLKQGGRCYIEMRNPEIDGDEWWSSRLLPDLRNCLTAEAARLRPNRFDSKKVDCWKRFTISFRRENCWVLRGVELPLNFEQTGSNVTVYSWVHPDFPDDVDNSIDVIDEGESLHDGLFVGNDCPPVINFCFNNVGVGAISKIWIYQRCGDCSDNTPSQLDSTTLLPQGIDTTYVTSVDTANVEPICVEWDQDALDADPNNPTNSIMPLCFPINLWDIDICAQRTFRPVINISNLGDFAPGELKVRATWMASDFTAFPVPLGDSEWVYIEDMGCSWQELGTITFPEYCLPEALKPVTYSSSIKFTPDAICLEFCSTTGGTKKVVVEVMHMMPVLGWRQYESAGIGGRDLEPTFLFYDYPDKNYQYQFDNNNLQEFNFKVRGNPIRLCPSTNNRFYFLMADENGDFQKGTRLFVKASYNPTKRCL